MQENQQDAWRARQGFYYAFPADFGNKEAIMRFVKAYLQHRFNPLHVYCRLRDYGLSSNMAIRVSNAYERFYKVCGLGKASLR